MSSHVPCMRDNRIDSSVDLHASFSSHLVRNGTMDSSECSTAGTSLTTYSGPWSQFNPDCARSIHSSVIDHRLPTIDPRICLSPTRYLDRISRSPSPDHHSSPSHVILCGQCRVEFTGHWRRSNLLRHVRHKHGGTKLYACEVEGCDKVFKRSDAKLKHMRTHHDDYTLPRTVKKKRCSVTDADFEVGQWLSASTPLPATVTTSTDVAFDQPQNVNGSAAEAEASRHAARMVFVALRRKLGERRFARELPGLLGLWKATVQQLCNQHSATYSLYCQIFDDLHTIATTINRGHANHERPRGESSHPRNSRGSSSIAAEVGSTRNQSDRVKKRSKKPGHAASEPSNSIRAAEDTIKQDKSGGIGCPWYQRWDQLGGRERGEARPCSGCSVTYMSEVRSHFDPKRVGTHRNLLPHRYYQHCPCCKKDFIEERIYETHICSPLSISHHDIESQWIPLCRTLFIEDEDVPSPYVGASTPLDRALVARHQARSSAAALGSIAPAEMNFLGGRIPDSINQARQQIPHLGSVPPGLYASGMNLVLQNAVSSAMPQADRTYSASQGNRPQQDRVPASIRSTMSLGPLQHIRQLSERVLNTAGRVQLAQYGRNDIEALVTDLHAAYNEALRLQQHYLASARYHAQPPDIFPDRVPSSGNALPAPETTVHHHFPSSVDMHGYHNSSHGGTQQELLNSNAYTATANQSSLLSAPRHNGVLDDYDQEEIANTISTPYILSPAVSNIAYGEFDMRTANSSQGHYANSSTFHPSTSTGVTSDYDIIDPILEFMPSGDNAGPSYDFSCFPRAPPEEVSPPEAREYHDMQASWEGFQA